MENNYFYKYSSRLCVDQKNSKSIKISLLKFAWEVQQWLVTTNRPQSGHHPRQQRIFVGINSNLS